MVTKKKATKKSRVKVGKLKVNKETVKDLTGDESKQIKGGAGLGGGTARCVAAPCGPSLVTSCPGACA